MIASNFALVATTIGCILVLCDNKPANAFHTAVPTSIRRRLPTTGCALQSTSSRDDHLDDPTAIAPSPPSRRTFFSSSVVAAALILTTAPAISHARYVLDDETGDYVELEDQPWQAEWKARLDQASTMSKDEILQAARGAGNVALKTGPESEASKKRRAMSACRDVAVRNKVGLKDEKECTARVFGGEVEFLLEAL